VESRVRGDAHARFGGRVEETGEVKASYRASARPYWSVLEELDSVERLLVNANQVKNLPGRKTDV
jgi:hypothetical protein